MKKTDDFLKMDIKFDFIRNHQISKCFPKAVKKVSSP